MGERLICIQEVSGSIPLGSTIQLIYLIFSLAEYIFKHF